MRKYLLVVALAMVVLAGSVLVLHQGKAETSSAAPTLVVSPSVSPLTKNANLVLMGSGYQAKTDINILFYDAFGSIGALENTVKTDDKGNFAMAWNTTDYIRGTVPDGVTTIMTADVNFNILASAPVVFANISGPYAKWSDVAKAVFPAPKPSPTAAPKPTAAAEAKPTAAATGTAAPKP